MVLQRELAKLGVTLNDRREVFPVSEMPQIADRLGLTFYGPGSGYYLHENTPVVAIIHEDGNDTDVVQYGTIGELQNENIVGVFTRKV